MSAWLQVLRTIEPAYDILTRAMEMGLTIKPILEKRNRIWTITLKEVWPEDVNHTTGISSFGLDNKVHWTEEELLKWSGVKRMAWDQWYFDNKRQAEKFITLYYMVWAE